MVEGLVTNLNLLVEIGEAFDEVGALGFGYFVDLQAVNFGHFEVGGV